MKKFIVVLTIVFPFIFHAQNFAPNGAEWHYTERHAFSDHISFLHIMSVGDTIVNGKSCSVLENNGAPACSFYEEKYFVYEEDSVVYFYSPVIDDFQILYDLNVKKDSSWIVIYQVYDFAIDTVQVIVDSVRTVTINGQDLIALDVGYKSLNSEIGNGDISSTIIEIIGDQYYLFNFLSMAEGIICDGNYSGGLRCYQDTYLGFYSTGIADSCELVTSLNENYLSQKVDVFPNPSTGSTKISYQLYKPEEIILSFFNSQGEQVDQFQQRQESGTQQLLWDAKGLPGGMYFFTLQAGKQVSTGKLVLMK